jgi:uncharacterized membrane protein
MYTIWYMDKNKKKNNRKIVRKKIQKYLKITRVKRAIISRIISIIVTFLIGWVVTGNPFIGLSIGAADTIFKLVIYYFYEGWWERKITKDIRKIKHKNTIK